MSAVVQEHNATYDAMLSTMQATPDLVDELMPRLTKYIPHTPTPKQQAFLWLTCKDAFYGGAAGGGKSDALLMAALQYVDCPNYAALLLRETYKNLDKPGGLIPRSKEWLFNTDAKYDSEQHRWTFPSGATIDFGYIEGPNDHYSYQSAEYQFVGIDECVNMREEQALYMFSRLRRLEGSDIPLRFRCASNPPTRGQLAKGGWVKERYVNPETRGNRIFIPAKIEDNPHLDAETYIENLEELDVITRTQLRFGDWEIHVVGKMFQYGWFNKIPPKDVPTDNMIWCRGWDLAASEESHAAYTCGVLLGIHTPTRTFYMADVCRFRGTPGFVMQKVLETAQTDGIGVKISIPQDPGQAGKAQARAYIGLLNGFQVHKSPESGSKVDRAAAFSSQVEHGKVFLVTGAWNTDYIDEAVLFPESEYLDQIDGTSRSYHHLLTFLESDVPAPGGVADGALKNKNGFIMSEVPKDASDFVGRPELAAVGMSKEETENLQGFLPVWK